MWIRIIAVVLCVLASTSAQYYGNNAGPRYSGPIHIPVIGPNGVPQEPPELVAARRTHLAAFNNVPQQQQQYQQQAPQYNPQQQYQPQAEAVQPRYNGPWAKIGPDGMPQYDQAVAAARAAHQSAYSEVNARNAQLHAQSPGYQSWQGRR